MNFSCVCVCIKKKLIICANSNFDQEIQQKIMDIIEINNLRSINELSSIIDQMDSFEEKDLSFYIECLLRSQGITSINDIKDDIIQQLKPLSRKTMKRVVIRLGYSGKE